MKVKIPLALVLLLAISLGYLLGTEAGRSQRNMILVKVSRKPREDELEAEPEASVDAEAAAAK
jgi:hypothetical protein